MDTPIQPYGNWQRGNWQTKNVVRKSNNMVKCMKQMRNEMTKFPKFHKGRKLKSMSSSILYSSTYNIKMEMLMHHFQIKIFLSVCVCVKNWITHEIHIELVFYQFDNVLEVTQLRYVPDKCSRSICSLSFSWVFEDFGPFWSSSASMSINLIHIIIFNCHPFSLFPWNLNSI